MNDIYNKTKMLYMNEQRDKYYGDVDVDIFLEGDSTAEVGKVTIPFDVEFEHRSWGVKGVSIALTDKITVPYVEVEGESEVDKEVEVELAELKIDWLEGGSYSPADLTLYLKPDGSVNYDKSLITFYYLKP